MRKHSLNHINSHQNLKVFLYHELNKKSHYFPQNKSQKRDANTKPKKYEHRKEGTFGSWLYESSKQNRNRTNLQDFGSKKGIKTTKKNSCSYIACNTSAEDLENNKNFDTFNFGNEKTTNKEIFKIPVAITDCDAATKQSVLREDLDSLYTKMKGLLGKYREQLTTKDKKIKELKKENKFLKDKNIKGGQRKI